MWNNRCFMRKTSIDEIANVTTKNAKAEIKKLFIKLNLF